MCIISFLLILFGYLENSAKLSLSGKQHKWFNELAQGKMQQRVNTARRPFAFLIFQI